MTADEIHEILTVAKANGFDGFSGHCAAAAVAINRVVLGGHGQIVCAFNSAFFDHGELLGHVAVRFDGAFWDADGVPKSVSEIEEWAVLDHTDPEYRLLADQARFELTSSGAKKIVVHYIEDADAEASLLQRFDSSQLADMETTLNLAMETALGAGVAPPRP